MKQKIFAGIATLLIIVAGVITPLFGFVTETFQVKHTYAQAPGSAQTFDGESPQTSTTVTTQSGASSTTTASGVITSVGDDKPTTEIVNESPDDCGTYEFGCKFIVAVSQTITSVPFFLATLAGLVSDYSIWYSLQSSTYTAYDGKAGEEGIVVTGWKLVRDFSNLLFIFALFVIAFTLILNLDERAAGAPMGLDPKRTIARVIIMALLVNFSFFMGRAVIDLTNIVGLTFYNKITVAPKVIETGDDPYAVAAQQDVTSFYTNAVGIRSITSGILAQINPQRFILQNADIKYSDGAYGALFFIAIMSAVFGFFLVYLFLSIAILFISRTIGLFLAVIISPIAFVSYTIPALQKQSFIGFDDWLKQFFGLAFMAPVYLFFLYISLQFFKISLTAGSGLITMAAQVLVQFLVIGILLIYGKNLAKDLSGKMGTMVTNAVTSVATGAAVMAGAVATGGLSGAANLGRRYVGEKLSEGGGALGKTVFGDDKYAAMQTQWKRAGGFNIFKGVDKDGNPERRGIMSSLKAINRVATAGSEPNQFMSAFREGKVANRKYDYEQAKKLEAKLKKEEAAKKAWAAYGPEAKAKKKRLEEIEKDLEQAKKDKDDNIIDKDEYIKKTKALNQEKRDLNLPEDERKKKEAERAQKSGTDAIAAANTDSKLTNNQSKLTDLTNRIGAAATAVTEADQRLKDIAVERAQTAQELADKEKEIAEAQANQSPVIKTLSDRRDAALLRQKAINDQLAKLDNEEGMAQKFGNFNDLDSIKKDRERLLKEKQGADLDASTSNKDYMDTKSGYDAGNQRLANERETIKNKDLALANEQAANVSKKNTNDAAQNALNAEKAAAESAKTLLESQKAAETAELARLNQEVANAKKTVEDNKKIAEINKELAQRTGVRKTDTDNRERNQQRVETLQERLRNITSGGTPPTTP